MIQLHYRYDHLIEQTILAIFSSKQKKKIGTEIKCLEGIR